jgi:hypothetical protein
MHSVGLRDGWVNRLHGLPIFCLADSVMASLNPLVRRTTALALMMCFGFFTAEILIADVHDGDVGANHPISIETTTSHADAGGLPQFPTEGAHSMHVCHCIHAHGGLAALASVSSPTLEGATVPPVRGDRVPASLARAPQLRPPIS